MSKRRRGDDASQELLPLPGVERIAPSGKIITSPTITPTVTALPPESSVPSVPRSTDAPGERRIEAHGAWIFGRGIQLKVLSVGARSWREFVAWETTRAVIWYFVYALCSVVLLASSCSGSPPPTLDGWAPVTRSN